jgi:hypothetical protein
MRILTALAVLFLCVLVFAMGLDTDGSDQCHCSKR